MPKIVRTARGEQVDFDAIIIKQQLAQAPMNIEVARRKEFIDSKDVKARAQPSNLTVDSMTPVDQSLFVTNGPTKVVAQQEFEIDDSPASTAGPLEEPVPIIRERKKRAPY